MRGGANAGGLGKHWESGPPDQARNVVESLRMGARILDLGCGSGRDAAFLTEKGFVVWGVDRSEEAIRRAIAKLQRRNLLFLMGDAERLPFSADSFDGVYSRYALNCAPLNAVASEVFRVLKVGGTAFLYFILNMNMAMAWDARSFLQKDDILSAFGAFRILRSREFRIFDFVGERSHSHDCFSVILKKPRNSSASPSERP